MDTLNISLHAARQYCLGGGEDEASHLYSDVAFPFDLLFTSTTCTEGTLQELWCFTTEPRSSFSPERTSISKYLHYTEVFAQAVIIPGGQLGLLVGCLRAGRA